MYWEKLLSNKRLCQETPGNFRDDRTAFQVDYDRIVFSSAFRRLQDKTQVFPLAESDYVRTRLTHSLEVSCIARSLGINVGNEIINRHKLTDIHSSDFGTILATAALAHDLGNPPFGHSGEDAIRNWFNKSSVIKSIRKYFSRKELCDFQNYEGNAQGFRLLTVLQMPEHKGGMRLTYSTLAAFVKYPVESILIKKDGPISRKKYNFFQSEKELFKEVAENTGLIRKDKKNYSWARHPLAFLIEASDDICYHIIDFEDGYREGLLKYQEIKDLYSAIIADERINYADQLKDERSKVEYLRAKAIQKLVEEIKESFLENESEILRGEFNSELISIIPSTPYLKRIIERSVESVYSNSRVLEIEAAGFEVANGLLELFFESVMDYYNHGRKASAQSKKIMQIIPVQFHPHHSFSYYEILMNILDYFSGMTDSYAVSLYKKLKGISLPGNKVF